MPDASAVVVPTVGLPFRPISIRKVVILSLATFGAYQIHWFYQNWWAVRLRGRFRVKPLWRSLLFFVFCYPLFLRIKSSAQAHGVTSGFRPIVAGAVCTVFALVWRLDETFWPTVVLTTIPLVAAQREINRLSAVVAPSVEPNDTFSRWQVVGVTIGGLFFALALVATLLVAQL